MSDLIDRQAAIDALCCECQGRCIPCESYPCSEVRALENVPSAQPERKKGRWEMLPISINPPVYKCSVCGGHALQTVTGCLINRHLEANLTDFCPNCGADMRGEQNG